MKITKDEIDYLSKLARIWVSDEEKESLSKDLTKITDLVSKIDELPTENVPPLVTISEDTHNFFREDEVKDSLPIEKIEKLAHRFRNRCFIVPKIVE